MTNSDVVDYLDNMNNSDVVTNVMAILNAFIDIRSESDRNVIKSGLETEGVTIDASICHRDE